MNVKLEMSYETFQLIRDALKWGKWDMDYTLIHEDNLCEYKREDLLKRSGELGVAKALLMQSRVD